MEDKNNSIKNRYDRIAPIYDKFEYIMERLAFNKWRKCMWELVSESAEAGDKLLEVGVGTGKNIPPEIYLGCQHKRHTLNNIKQAGLQIKSVENLWLDIFKLIIAKEGK